jgi:hypothetical protein
VERRPKPRHCLPERLCRLINDTAQIIPLRDDAGARILFPFSFRHQQGCDRRSRKARDQYANDSND